MVPEILARPCILNLYDDGRVTGCSSVERSGWVTGHPSAPSGGLENVPGVGDVTAQMLVSELPELGKLNRRQIAMLKNNQPM